ncbi:hypothetical protein HGM15179_013079 [Zosterops borbonicus]|uniref:Uncharacterized protein n=1 Tax=Zosterops borbonicus TaxID=364589 RepID=A0A8K1LHK4_9PASS|nr:hypothetical protein HGM15179_013079 [Zosterops borbonicus]
MPSRGALKGWRQVHKKPLKLNKANYNVLDKSCGNPRDKYRMGREWIESSAADKVLGVLTDKKLNMTHQHVPVALKAKGALNCTTRCDQQGIFCLYKKPRKTARKERIGFQTCMTRVNNSKKDFDFNVCRHELMPVDPIKVDDCKDALDETADLW